MVISGIRNVDIVGVAGSIPAAPTIPFPAKSIISQTVGSASMAAPPASGNTWVTGRVFWNLGGGPYCHRHLGTPHPPVHERDPLCRDMHGVPLSC